MRKIEHRFGKQISGFPRLFFIRETPETDTDAFARFLRRQSDRPQDVSRGRVLFCGAADIGNPAHGSLDPENQADQFASDLLLPEFMFRPRIIKMKRLALSAVREIAEEFNVSLTATLLKIAESNRFPIIVVCHNKRGRRWFRPAPMVPGWWFPKHDLDAESIAFKMLFGGAAEISYARKIGAEAWFEFRGTERYEIQEQSFLLPNDEVLTVLILPQML